MGRRQNGHAGSRVMRQREGSEVGCGLYAAGIQAMVGRGASLLPTAHCGLAARVADAVRLGETYMIAVPLGPKSHLCTLPMSATAILLGLARRTA